MKLYKIIPAVFAATLVLGLATTVNAATWFVNSATGNDANDCLSASTACMTINAAIGKASSGDTIDVADGTYNESVNINKSLTLHGAEATVPGYGVRGTESVISATCSPVQIAADNVTLDGFTVQGSTQADPCLIVGIFMNPGGFGFHGGAQIINNIVQNNISGIEFDNDGTIPAKVQFNLIRNNNNTGPGSGNGIETNFGLMNATIDSNKFVGQMNSSYLNATTPASTGSVTISNNTLDAGIALFNASGVTITGNSSVGNTVDGTVYLGGGDSGIVITNNVLDNGIEAVVVENAFGGPNSSVTVSPNNCIAGNSTNGLRVASGGYTGAPGSLNATSNWWGAASGPNYNGTGPGTGDKITDPDHVVTFTPFLTSKNGTPCFVAVGPPTTAAQCKNGGWQTFNTPRTFKNQGDCIQYVNTGK